MLPTSKQSFETPFQRLHRLQSEVAQFSADMAEITASKVVSLSDVCAVVSTQLAGLEKELASIAAVTTLPALAVSSAQTDGKARNVFFRFIYIFSL